MTSNIKKGRIRTQVRCLIMQKTWAQFFKMPQTRGSKLGENTETGSVKDWHAFFFENQNKNLKTLDDILILLK